MLRSWSSLFVFALLAGSLAACSPGVRAAKRQAAQIHVGALEELGSSLETEIAPQVIELEDRTITLSGSVEQQYTQWRDILSDIYEAEVGSLPEPEDTQDNAGTL